MPRVDSEDDLPPNEWARARRRDHDAGAATRAGMRTGLAKQFKQVLDVQVKRARGAVKVDEEELPAGDEDGAGDGVHARYHGHHHRHEPQQGPSERGDG